ncbi:MAG: type I 3-dehydroquinate dehydratase [Desulforhopalus sp.]
MRQQSRIQITVRTTLIGGALPLICLPLVAQDRKTLLKQTEDLVGLQPDLLEWRVDEYRNLQNPADCIPLLQAIRTRAGDLPLIFTCRIDREGGFQKISQKRRLELITHAIQSGFVEIVDIELCNEKPFIESVKVTAEEHGVKLIFSHHNFDHTPSEEFICNTLKNAQTAGAHIAKIAVMPQNYGDVLTLLSGTRKARNRGVEIPMVTISMGTEGVLSRLAGGLFGSDITFAAGNKSSAPGQTSINDLRAAMSLLYQV